MSSRLNTVAESDVIVISTAGSDKEDRPMVNQTKSSMFFKTKLCTNFMAGKCHNGSCCSFAHGREDMRFPPPNWRQLVAQGEDRGNRTSYENNEQKRMQPCKIFQSGKGCPYGEKCVFQHEYPRNSRVDDSNENRKGTSINVQARANGPTATVGTCNDNAARDEDKKHQFVVGSAISDGNRGNARFSYWKTKTCTKYETTGHCPFGDTCHFAHVQAEVQASVGHNQARFSSSAVQQPTPSPIHSSAARESDNANDGPPPYSYRVGPSINWIARKKGLQKISRIYGDWPDMPLN